MPLYDFMKRIYFYFFIFYNSNVLGWKGFEEGEEGAMEIVLGAARNGLVGDNFYEVPIREAHFKANGGAMGAPIAKSRFDLLR